MNVDSILLTNTVGAVLSLYHNPWGVVQLSKNHVVCRGQGDALRRIEISRRAVTIWLHTVTKHYSLIMLIMNLEIKLRSAHVVLCGVVLYCVVLCVALRYVLCALCCVALLCVTLRCIAGLHCWVALCCTISSVFALVIL